MRTNKFNKRDWSSYFISIKRHNWSFLTLTLLSLEFIFSFLCIKYYLNIWLFFLIINTLFLLFISWRILLSSILLITLFIFVFSLYENSKNIQSNISGNFYVSDVISNGIIIDFNLEKIYIKTNQIFKIDDLINIEINDVKKIDINSNFNKYLKSISVNYISESINENLKFIGKKSSLRRNISDYFLNNLPYYSRYAPLIILGYRYSKNQIIINKIKNISILHLFTISGFHINIFLIIIEKILIRFKIKNKYIHFCSLFFLIIYISILNFPIAATRAFVFSSLCLINKYFYKNKFHKLNLLAITMLIFFMLNPYVIFSLSFIFTFIMIYAITIINYSLNSKNKKIKTSLIIWLFSLIINIIANKQINILSFFSNLFFGPIISFSYILTFIFFWFQIGLDNYYFLIDILINIWQYLIFSWKIDLNVSEISFITFIMYLLLIIDYYKKINKLKLNSNYK